MRWTRLTARQQLNILIRILRYYYYCLYAVGSRGGKVFTVCLSVCLSVYPHDIAKNAAARITKRDAEMFHHEF